MVLCLSSPGAPRREREGDSYGIISHEQCVVSATDTHNPPTPGRAGQGVTHEWMEGEEEGGCFPIEVWEKRDRLQVFLPRQNTGEGTCMSFILNLIFPPLFFPSVPPGACREFGARRNDNVSIRETPLSLSFPSNPPGKR